MSNPYFKEEGKISGGRKIHAPSVFARKNLTYVQEIGELKSLKQHASIRENLASYLFFFVKEGKGSVTTGGKVYEVSKGDCIFLDCMKHYEHLSSEEEPWTIAWVHFYGALPVALYPIFLEGNENGPVFRPENLKKYESIMEKLMPLQEEKGVLAELKSNGLLEKLLERILKAVAKDKELSIDQKIEETEEYENLRESVNEHCAEHGLLGTLAVQYGTHPEKLNAFFEEKYGITLQEYIVNRRYNNAKESLHFSIKPTEEVIREAGFSDPEVFIKMLEEEEHITPEEYRKKWAQWVKS